MRPGRNGKTSPDRAYFSMVWVNPLDVSLVEIGYSHNDEPRLKWHRDYSSSIYNPFEAILGLLYPQKFQLHQYVIHCCVDVRHVGLAELLFNRLGEGYIGDAGGFGQSPAGFSVSSPDDCTTAYWEDAAKSSDLLQENGEYERRKAVALAKPVHNLVEQFQGVVPPEDLALDDNGLIAYIAETERRLDGRTDDVVYLEEAADFYRAE
ncbi:hypothetical protein KC332_g1481 [Hortaea werneckii]|nr:hypothetical protein KC342_g2240 [Hortaea werneckii]KAI6846507.1 hypothetical protein KC358_g2813 [Hortaea werneckii]KAI6850002.1 hypothetical protein KC350_g2345 [Hortaea werneckii]KAI6943484.1 hypothetical protein KC341_g1465 [Hortaea werneckii]KAI6946789.1 hypothetical protein KC348_g2906 [Hortaea werneckii]